jgi:hypothetical protein
MIAVPEIRARQDVHAKEGAVSAYSITLFLHVVGALGLFAVLGLEWAGLYYLKRARGTAQAREWLRLVTPPGIVGGAAALLTLLTGIYLSATRWGARGWIVVGLAGMVVIAVLGAAVSGRRVAAMARAVPAEDGPIPPAFGRQLHDPVLAISLRLRTALFLGIVFLMSIRPSLAGSVGVITVAAAAGLAAALPVRGGRRSVMAGSER